VQKRVGGRGPGRLFTDETAQALPVEARPGIRFARGGNIRVADDFERAISTLQGGYEWRKFCILNIRERLVVGAFQLDAD
jgi:hypothetical protein